MAEWTIRLLTGKERAASIVGDLVEIAEQRGSLWFRMAVSGVVIRLLWRPFLAFVAAFYAGSWTAFRLDMAVHGIHAQHRPPELWMPAFYLIIWAGRLLWICAPYLVISYGFRDRFAQLALLTASLVSAVACYWWQPAILAVCSATCLAVIWFSIREKSWRTALALLLALVSGFCGFVAALFLSSHYQRLVHPGPIGSLELQEHPSLMWVYFFLSLAATWATTSMCSILHKWATRHRRANSEIDGSLAG